jgi:cell division protein FtsZ
MDLYSIFDEENEKARQEQDGFASGFDGNADETEETFIDVNESALSMETPFPITDADPLGIAGGTDAIETEVKNTIHNNNNQPSTAMKFDLPEQSSIIKVIGVGGGGSNAVNHMYRQGINGVDFVVCNTDKQALDMSPVPHKIVLGATLTEGRGAGSIPEVGRNAAIENIEDIRAILANNTKMVFITAGMGGGTGTGAAPIIAGIAREMGILTVAIVTVPFLFEGKKRRKQAEDGLEQLKQNVDTLLVICNDKLREMYGNLKLSDAFSHADDVLAIAAKSIAEVISLTQQINVDFADICTVMRNSGVAIMGSSSASGENRSIRAVETALNSPLLNDNNITGARYVLLNIISGADEITMDELGEITDYIQESAGQTAEIIKGYGVDPSLGDSVNVTIIATGFNQNNPVAYEYSRKPSQEKVVMKLEESAPLPVAETKAEAKIETVNPLEPFLVNKQPEPVAEVKPVEKTEAPAAVITNPLEPYLKKDETPNLFESKEETRQEPVAETSNPLEPFLLVKKEEISASVEPVANNISSEEEKAEFNELPFAELSNDEPVAEFDSQHEVSSSVENEPVAEVKDEIVPVVNATVEFEITNFSDEKSSQQESAADNVWASSEESVEMSSENEFTAELSSESVAEFDSVNEPVVEVNPVNEPVAEITPVNEPVMVSQQEPLAEIKPDSVSKLQSEEEAKKIMAEEIQKKAQERIQRLKELSMKLKTPQGLNEMEHEPAYKRRNIQLDNVPHSSESQVSRFTLTETEDKKIEIRPNNSFLHDNVD